MKTGLAIFLIFTFCLMQTEDYAQNFRISSKNKKAVKYYKAAENAFRQRDYRQAEEDLAKAIRKDKNMIEAWLLLGDVHTELGGKEKAISDFQEAVSIDSAFFPRAYFFIANLSFESGNYATSANYFRRYLAFKDEESLTRAIARQRLSNAVFAENAVSHPVCKPPVNLDGEINTEAEEYINFVDATISSLTFTRKAKKQVSEQGQIYYSENFYRSLNKSGAWQTPEPVVTAWAEGLDMGGMTLSIDGRKMFFTGCNWPGGFGSCDLYVSVRRGRTWQVPVNLGRNVNTSGWDSQPAVSSDGKRLFFASKRKGGHGGSDIWMSVKLPDGKWSPPVNLGDSINTPGNEMSPFLHADGKTLYFSSTGNNSLGKADLFISRKDETGRWSKAQNLGYPINSRFDEINIFISLDGLTAWISSNREGGLGGFDIYRFELPAAIRPGKVLFVKGIVKDKETEKKLAAEVDLTNLLSGTLSDSTVSDAQTGEFLMVLHPGTNYAFNISKTGYLLYSENFNLNSTVVTQSVEKEFLLERLKPGKRMVLNNIFFDFDRATLKAASFSELNKVVQLLNANPGISIQINGYTDNIGTDKYNFDLSLRRAKAVYDYLVVQGISFNRLSYKGFGASRPVADNQTEKGRSQNRRTEIVIR
ncbi:MAG TPA: tetratricopeptide repeat protein [Bacteroidetes bacterium]|nr:tetratricopeptide repeat protein [Bacteroidota bacterium]